MFFFLRKKRIKRDTQIEALKKDILKKQDDASATIKKVNRKLDRGSDVTLMIYYATNGNRRQHHGR